MTIAYVQSAGTNFTTPPATNIIKAYTSANTAGNLLFAIVGWGDTTNTMSLTDTAGNTWAQIGATQTDSTNVQRFALFYAKNSNAGANTVTATMSSGSAGYCWMIIAEYSGLDTTAPLDVSAFHLGSATNATDNASSGSATTTANGDLIIGASFEDGTGTVTASAGTGFTSRLTQGTSMTLEDKVQGTAGAVAATFTMSASTSSAFTALASFKAAGGGGSVNLTGVTATITVAAPAGTVTRNTNVNGAVASVTVAAPAGGLTTGTNATIAGVTAHLTIAAPIGSVSVVINVNDAGPVATLAIAAPAGGVTLGANTSVAGVVSAITLAAPAGSTVLSVTLSGATAHLAVAAPAGSVSAAGSVNVAGVTVGLTVAAPAGSADATSPTVNIAVDGVLSYLGLASPAGNLSIATTIYLFSPPTFAYNELHGIWELDHLFGRMQYDQIGTAVFKTNGFYTQVTDPDSAQIDAADIAYLGGRIYQIAKTEADSLTAAGYGSYITTTNAVITV